MRRHKGRKEPQQQQAAPPAYQAYDALRYRASLAPRPGQLTGQLTSGQMGGGMGGGARERAAVAQAEADARAAGFGQPAPVTTPLRGEFSVEQVRWIALYLAENRPFRWTVIPHETRIGTQRFYAEIVHIDYYRTHLSRTIHDQGDFVRFLFDDAMNEAPMHIPRAATPLPTGHRR